MIHLYLCYCLTIAISLSATLANSGFSSGLSRLIYDDYHISSRLDDRFPYLKLQDGTYQGPREYFNFTNVFEPSSSYYATVNIEQHLFQEFRAMEITSSIATMDQWHYSDTEQEISLRSELFRSDIDQSDQCKQDLDYIYRIIELAAQNSSYLFSKGEKNIQFLRYIDTWARPPSETYLGHAYWVGSYRGCKQASLTIEGRKNDMHFRYCWAKMRHKDWPQEDEMKPSMSIKSGICLPNSCNTELAMHNKDLIRRIQEFNFSPMHRERINRIIDIYCLPPNPGKLSTSGEIFVLVMATWLLLIALCSIYKLNTSRKLPAPLECLTIQNNFEKFINDDEPELSGRVDLRPMGLTRFIGSLFVCFGHAALGCLWVFNATTINIQQGRWEFTSLPSSFFRVMDLFLVQSGILATYIFMSRYPGNKIKSIIRLPTLVAINAMRFLRLAPVAVVSMIFMKLIYPHLAEGPNWDYGTYKHSIQGACQRSSWWRILLLPIMFGYKGNQYYNECLLVSWYIVADLKIFFLVPVVVYWICTSKSNKRRLLIATVSLLITCLHSYKDMSYQQVIYFQQLFKYGNVFMINTLNTAFGEPGYYSVLTRQNSVVVGLLAGYWIKLYDQGRIKRWPNWMRGWPLMVLIIWECYDCIAPAIAQHFYLKFGLLPGEETIKLSIIIKSRIDAIIFAIIMIRITTDLAPKMMQFSLPFYKLSKLSYCLFFVHTIILSYILSANEGSRIDTSAAQHTSFIIFITTTSMMISFPLYILFESPIAQLTGSLFAAPSREKEVKVVAQKSRLRS